MLTRHIYRSIPARLCTPTRQQSSVPIARCRYASSNKSVDQQRHAKDNKVKQTTPSKEQPKQTKHKLTAKERDEMMMQKMKERMGQEGDEAWEDGRPAESGLPRNVKNNMFRLI